MFVPQHQTLRRGKTITRLQRCRHAQRMTQGNDQCNVHPPGIQQRHPEIHEARQTGILDAEQITPCQALIQQRTHPALQVFAGLAIQQEAPIDSNAGRREALRCEHFLVQVDDRTIFPEPSWIVWPRCNEVFPKVHSQAFQCRRQQAGAGAVHTQRHDYRFQLISYLLPAILSNRPISTFTTPAWPSLIRSSGRRSVALPDTSGRTRAAHQSRVAK
ncbi:hypothetical protein SAMN05216577_10120 [Pseudomonas citronellolis]|uniref:Uncharacterized protein n=1 Tax=Pseudomonas citronellolis TaxID=53408 RepID=A0AAQ1HI07_9PSED|nr:hypothetical protein SAMN05216577_10120 [Pseudomonas citronellolis]